MGNYLLDSQSLRFNSFKIKNNFIKVHNRKMNHVYKKMD